MCNAAVISALNFACYNAINSGAACARFHWPADQFTGLKEQISREQTSWPSLPASNANLFFDGAHT
jgi:hypothetical protein